MQGNADLTTVQDVAAPLLAQQGGSNPLVSFLPLILIVAAFYFFLIRPQRNRQREQLQMQRAVRPGQRILTSAGMHATIVAVEDDIVVLEIAPGVECRYVKRAIMQVLDGDNPGVEQDEHDTPADAGEDSRKAGSLAEVGPDATVDKDKPEDKA